MVTKFISRHATPYDDIDPESLFNSQETLDNYYTELLSDIPEIQTHPRKKNLLDIATHLATFELSLAHILKRDKAYSYQFLFYANQLGFDACLLRYYNEVEITVGTTKVISKGEGTQPLVTEKLLPYLPNYMHLCFLLRDQTALDFYGSLALVQPENQHYQRRSQFLHSQLLQSICIGNKEKIEEHLTLLIHFEQNEARKKKLEGRAFYEQDFQQDASTPYSTGYPPLLWEGDQAEYLKLPYLLVLQSIFTHNEPDFNENLLVALENHKAYFGNFLVEGEEIRNNCESYLSLPLMAACALAHDRGLKREVESDYIPEWLVKGEFEGLTLVVE